MGREADVTGADAGGVNAVEFLTRVSLVTIARPEANVREGSPLQTGSSRGPPGERMTDALAALLLARQRAVIPWTP